jgi:hypothetical protein
LPQALGPTLRPILTGLVEMALPVWLAAAARETWQVSLLSWKRPSWPCAGTLNTLAKQQSASPAAGGKRDGHVRAQAA